MSVTVHKPQAVVPSLVPQTMEQAIRLAELMSKAKLVPQHLQGAPGDCLLIVEQAMRWNASPYAVAQCTSSIKGKLMFEGKLVHAVIESSGAIDGRISYEFAGSGDDRTVTVTATRSGEKAPKSVTVKLSSARTTNEMWVKQPDQMLCYHGVRVWARRWTPGPLLGIYTREEIESGEAFEGQTIEGAAAQIVDTGEAAGTRDAINASIPLKDTAPWQSRLDDSADQLEAETDGTKWLALLTKLLALAGSRDEVAAMQGIPCVAAELKKAPAAFRAGIQAAFAAAFRRVEPAPTADAGEVPIAGEEYARA